uniref:Mitochondrial import inner membrane translocase subunit TIM22 n=1 Tax=Chrysotila carterae TaxID=13221 RepID=A0A7S4C3Y9_CHRCT
MAAAKKPRSCLAKAIGAFLDGGIIGGAIGGIMASRTAIAFGPSLGALRILAVGMGQSGLSLGGFLAAYNGGICSLERMRNKRDVANPFIVGGIMGVAGSIPSYATPVATAPWAYRNPRALAGAGLSSALLCSFFWSISGPRESGDGRAAGTPPAEQPRTGMPAQAPPPPSYSGTYQGSRVPRDGYDGTYPSPGADDSTEDLQPDSGDDPNENEQLQAVPGAEQLSDPWAKK